MANFLLLLKDYLLSSIKITAEAIAWLILAGIIGKGLQLVLYGGISGMPLGPAAIAAVVFSVSFSQNYCFLQDDKYGLLQLLDDSDDQETTLLEYLS